MPRSADSRAKHPHPVSAQLPPVPRHLNESATRWGLLPALLIVWAAPFFGGSVEPWARAILFFLLGLLLIIYPPQNALSRAGTVLLAIFALLPLSAFLPAALAGVPPWRRELVAQFAVPLPGTISTQPWFAFDAWQLWLGSLIWVWWLAGQNWTRVVRKPLAELFALGMLLLAAIAILNYHAGRALPFWHNERHFGPFPNRNQTADLFSLSFILVLALLHMAALKKSRLVILWSGGLLLLGYALILNFSRAGILLPAAGVAGYWLLNAAARPSSKKLAIGLSCLLIGLSLFLAFGGTTVDRFLAAKSADSVSNDFRLLIFRDTLHLTAQNPIFGVGLAGFEWVFPLFRKVSLAEQRAIHPESDWLWLAAEIGWPGALLILGSAIWLVFRAIRTAIRKPHPLRVAGSVCGALFILHGCFDVSGHRAGTFFPAMFLFTLAWPPETTRPGRPPIWLPRLAAVFSLLAALGWLFNLQESKLWPSPQTVAGEKRQIERAIASLSPASALSRLAALLPLAPLDWELYYQRGASHILQKREWPSVLQDFRLAEKLEPVSPRLPDIEGTAWLSYRPELAALPWAESLRRLTPETRPGTYENYLVLSAPWPRLHGQLEALAGGDVGLTLVKMRAAADARFPGELADFLHEHPALAGLNLAQKRQFFDLWADRGDPQKMLAYLGANPVFGRLSLFPRCRALAQLRNFEPACRDLIEQLPAPKIPMLQHLGSDDALRREFYTSGNLISGLALYQNQARLPNQIPALQTLLRLQKTPGAPPYVFYLLGKVWLEKNQFERSWEALESYARKTNF